MSTRLSIALIALVLLGTSAYAANESDSFEYSDSPLNHGWVVPLGFSAGVATSTDQVHLGSRSVRLTSNAGLARNLSDLGITQGADFVITIWFYDDLTSGNHKFALINGSICAGNLVLGVPDGAATQYHAEHCAGGVLVASKARSVGWHRFEWRFKANNTVALSIDGTTVADGPHLGGLPGDSRFVIHTSVNATAYFDDFAVSQQQSSVQISVAGNIGWVNTGLQVEVGSRLQIAATGTIQFAAGQSSGPDGSNTGVAGETGLVPTAPGQALVGRVGASGSLADLTGFLVGSSFDQTTDQSGTLFLGFNDRMVKPDRTGFDGHAIGDNSGAFTANVTIFPPPEIPVVLVHGWCGSLDTFGGMSELLTRELGVEVKTFNYAGDASSIDRLTRSDLKSLASRLALFVQSLGVKHVDIVTHSMGGLVVRAWMAGLTNPFIEYEQGPVHVRRLILAGTPNFGGEWSDGLLTAWKGARDLAGRNLGCGENSSDVMAAQEKQMLFGSHFVKELSERWSAVSTKIVRPEDILTVVGCGFGSGNVCTGDYVVNPASATLPEVPDSNVRYVTRGHVGSLVEIELGANKPSEDVNHPTYQLVRSFLKDGIAVATSTEVVEPGQIDGLLVLRLVEDTPEKKAFSESNMEGLAVDVFIITPQKPSPDPTGWWTVAAVPEDCCEGLWFMSLDNPQYLAPTFRLQVGRGRPVVSDRLTVQFTGLFNHDLVVTSVTVHASTGVPKGKLAVTHKVKNEGTAIAGDSFSRFYLSIDKERGAADILLGSRQRVEALPPQGEFLQTKPTMLTIPKDTIGGQYFVIACANDAEDADDRITESRGSNNCKASDTTVTVMRPDLAVVAVKDPPATAKLGEKLKVGETVKNVGDGVAKASTTYYYLSKNETLELSDVFLGRRNVAILSPADSPSQGDITVVIPKVGISEGAYFVFACADATDRVGDNNRANNCRASATQMMIRK